MKVSYVCKDKRKVIGTVLNVDEAFELIINYCRERNYEPPYIRGWNKDGIITYDVGSWSEFFEVDTKGGGNKNG